jgi:hypothetical protein
MLKDTATAVRGEPGPGLLRRVAAFARGGGGRACQVSLMRPGAVPVAPLVPLPQDSGAG